MNNNRSIYSTTALACALTLLVFAGISQTSYAQERSMGFYLSVSDRDRDSHYRRDKHWNRDYRRRHDYHPRYNYPYYRHNWSYYDRDYPNRYRRDYRRDNDSSRFLVTAAGAFFGVLVASEIIRYMNDVDRMRAREANMVAYTAPLGDRITWNNPQSYNSGSVTATRDGYSESGAYCREFYQTVSIGGRTEDAYGVACMQPDGAWRIVQ